MFVYRGSVGFLREFGLQMLGVEELNS